LGLGEIILYSVLAIVFFLAFIGCLAFSRRTVARSDFFAESDFMNTRPRTVQSRRRQNINSEPMDEVLKDLRSRRKPSRQDAVSRISEDLRRRRRTSGSDLDEYEDSS
jgi:hypothetical protein